MIVGLIAYLIAGILTFDIQKKKSNEKFPIFSWFLFADVPQKHHVRYTIKIYRADNVDLPQPLMFSEAALYSNPKSVSANKLIQDMGRAIEFHDDQWLQQAREVFEQNQIIRVQRYELIKLTYDPVERYQTGKMESDSIRFFEKGKE
ncbi:MAG: hypothetical protein V4507_00185 [Verrucomicrobiota bacterium]